MRSLYTCTHSSSAVVAITALDATCDATQRRAQGMAKEEEEEGVCLADGEAEAGAVAYASLSTAPALAVRW